jgi:hypothetical protein
MKSDWLQRAEGVSAWNCMEACRLIENGIDDATVDELRAALLMAKAMHARSEWPRRWQERASRTVAALEAAHARALKAAKDGEVADRVARARAASKAAAHAARTAARTEELVRLGLPPQQAQALAVLKAGPYDVVLAGTRPECDEHAIRRILAGLGYGRSQVKQVLERVVHIAPEPVAHLLHQSEAIRIKIQLEAAGATVRIKRHA